MEVFNMQLNPNKCSFEVHAGKKLGFMLTRQGIETNPDKCQEIINMRRSAALNELQQLKEKILTLFILLSYTGDKSIHFLATLKKSEGFQW